MSAEATVVRNYLDWMIDLPWYKKDKVDIDLNNAMKTLDEDHYGLEKVKERIIEFLAVQKRMEKIKGPILCLIGPPGVGKTSLPDILIGRSFPRLRGDNIYNKKKVSKKQTLKYAGVIARAHTAQVFLQLQNDGTQNDNIAFRAFVQRPQGTDSTVFSRINGKKKNVTAKVKTGKLRFSLAPGNRVRITYRLNTRPLWGGLYPGRDNEVRFLARSGKEKDNAAAYIQFR